MQSKVAEMERKTARLSRQCVTFDTISKKWQTGGTFNGSANCWCFHCHFRAVPEIWHRVLSGLWPTNQLFITLCNMDEIEETLGLALTTTPFDEPAVGAVKTRIGNASKRHSYWRSGWISYGQVWPLADPSSWNGLAEEINRAAWNNLAFDLLDVLAETIQHDPTGTWLFRRLHRNFARLRQPGAKYCPLTLHCMWTDAVSVLLLFYRHSHFT